MRSVREISSGTLDLRRILAAVLASSVDASVIPPAVSAYYSAPTGRSVIEGVGVTDDGPFAVFLAHATVGDDALITRYIGTLAETPGGFGRVRRTPAQAIRTMVLPTVSPRMSMASASGARSRPSTVVSSYFRRPSRIQAATSRCISGIRCGQLLAR
jgi:hypothetical protein